MATVWGDSWGTSWGDSWGAAGAVAAVARRRGHSRGSKGNEQPYGITVAEYLAELEKLKRIVEARKTPNKAAASKARAELDDVARAEPTHAPQPDIGQLYATLDRVEAAIQLQESAANRRREWQELSAKVDESIAAYRQYMRDEEEMIVLLLAAA